MISYFLHNAVTFFPNHRNGFSSSKSDLSYQTFSSILLIFVKANASAHISINDFAKCLYILCEREQVREEMGQNIYNLATTKFSAQTFAKTHIEIYESILNDFKDEKKYDYQSHNKN